MRFWLLILAVSVITAEARVVSDEEVQRLHRAAVIVDTHNDVPMKTLKGYDIAVPAPKGSTDLARLRAGNVSATFFAAYVAARYAKQGNAAAHCRRVINAIRNDIVGKHPNDFVLATTADEILAARKQGKLAALIGIEGGHAIEDSLERLREFFGLGARYMTLTHSNTNNWADSSGDITKTGIRHHNGLTQFGKDVVREMNKLGMIVDVSHVSDKTFWDAVATSSAPMFASHSSCRALTRHPRNMTDEMIRALAGKRGVVQINFACSFVSEKVRTDRPEEKQKVTRKYGDDVDNMRAAIETRFARATLADVVAHIDHVVKTAGIDAVGIGSDFDGIDCAPVGLDDVSKFPNLTRALLEKGYTQEQIHKIYGGNTLRVMREVEQTSKAMAAEE